MAGVEHFLSLPEITEDRFRGLDVSSILGVTVRGDVLSELAVSDRLAALVVTGKGQSASITKRIRSEIMQAMVAAMILDSGSWQEGCSAANGIIAPLYDRLSSLEYSDVEKLNPKTYLQEYAQALNWTIEYKLKDELGPAHARSFRSQVTVTIGSRRFGFTGAGSVSKSGSEAEAARKTIEYLRSLEGLADDSGNALFRKPFDLFARSVLVSTIAKLRTGPTGWRRVLRADLFHMASVLSTTEKEARSALERLRRIARVLDAEQELKVFEQAVAFAPVRRASVGAIAVDLLKRWGILLEELQPDELEHTSLAEVIAEVKLLLVVCSSLSAEYATTNLLSALRAAGLGTNTDCESFEVSARDADLICGLVRFATASARMDVSIQDGSSGLRVDLPIRQCHRGRLERALAIMRPTSLRCAMDGDHLLLYAQTGEGDWSSKILQSLHSSSPAELAQVRYIADRLHDFKNELNVAELSSRTARNNRDYRFKYLAVAEGSLERARGINAELRQVALRASEGERSLTITSFSLRTFLSEILRDVMDHAPSVAVSAFIDSTDVLFEADRSLLRAAIDNLFTNAIAAVQAGGDIRMESMYDSASNSVIVEVSNSGELAPNAVIESLNTGALPQSTNHEGVGFGIVSVRRAAQLHGGTFQLLNRDHRTFAVLELPSASTTSGARGALNVETFAVG